MANKAALLRPSARDNWKTPKEFLENLDALFDFTFDPCPAWDEYSSSGRQLWDGLNVHWKKQMGPKLYIGKNDATCTVQASGACMAYVNPPYGRQVGLWLAKALQEWEDSGVGSVFLLPARTDTKWWHELVMPNFTMLGFVQGRLHFDDCQMPAPFPCVLVRFGTVGADCWGIQQFDNKGRLL